MTGMTTGFVNFQGQPAVELALPQGDRVVVLLHGAQVVSWQTSDGAEHIYLSPQARLDGQTAIRGGVPVCFPQFNQRGPLVKHGFARNLPWQVEEASDDRIVLGLRNGPVTSAFWSEQFHAQLIVELRPDALAVRLRVSNTGSTDWQFTAALHSYFQVGDVTKVSLSGLQGAARWDAVRDVHLVQEAAPEFGEEFDSVFQSVLRALVLTEAGRGALQISQSQTCEQTVVWNPGAVLASKLADLPDDGWRQMLCVEAAAIDQPVTLIAGAVWEGWQELAWSRA